MGEGRSLRHGGRLKAAMERHGGEATDWLDLSTGISPFAYPFTPPGSASFKRLPEAADVDSLLAAARRAYGVPNETALVAAPGTQALIQLVPRLFEPGRASVDTMGYQEHGRCWSLAGHRVLEKQDVIAAVLDDDSVQFASIIHPHNPLGSFADTENVVAAAGALASRGGLLVIDEAFCDASPERSFLDAIPNGALVLRSFGKFYGLAGVRVGFAAGEAGLIDRIAAHLGPWAVPGPSIEIAAEALRDREWQARHSRRIAKISSQLAEGLSGLGFELVGRTELFVTARRANATDVEQRLAEQRILVRGFDQDPFMLRFGLPADMDAMTRVLAALGEI
ncbi:MAG: threonine-phosphate decarboxylase CobD [Pseudomonadota bacterium]